jgi:hypothetical protein
MFEAMSIKSIVHTDVSLLEKGAAKIGGSNVTMLRRRCDGNGPRCLFLDDEAGAPQMVHRLKP